jgi:lipoic acid synthetase
LSTETITKDDEAPLTGLRAKQRAGERLVKPSWLKVKAPGSPEYMETREVVKRLKLVTVCEEARCPNIGECWSHGTATFMIMGEFCTRRCHFCAVMKGDDETLKPLDPVEPFRVGKAVGELGLQHAVVTAVDRDDLADFGSDHFRRTIQMIHQHAPQCRVEVLIGDLRGDQELLKIILSANLQVLNHNLETVPRLYKKVRPGAGYLRSLSILEGAKKIDPNVLTKTGIMVGLGEKPEEVLALMDDLRSVDVDIFTIGQYLRPSDRQLPVHEFVTPEQFAEYERIGREKGFKFVESGPLVRSSYHAWKHSQPTY